jgi:tetratricopeptide (TPR) repeat protein
MRRLNLIFIAVLLTTVAVLGTGMHFLHRFQVHRNASSLLVRARSAESVRDLGQAEELLRQYLNLQREDGPTWEWYARIVDERAPESRRRERVFLIHEQALGHNEGNLKLERKCADLALELERYSDAKRHVTKLLEAIPKNSRDHLVITEMAELEDMMAQCEQGSLNPEQAEEWYRRSITRDPSRVAGYQHLSSLLRSNRKEADADKVVEAMIAANPKSGQALVTRWRYRRSYGLDADANDIARALNLAPDDADVLMAAAEVALSKKDTMGALKYLERGLERKPNDSAFYRYAAALQLNNNHPEKAEELLRRGIATLPGRPELLFQLAVTLLNQGKVDGENEALDVIKQLQGLGLADGYSQYLEARVLMNRQRWTDAATHLNSARAFLAADRQITAEINLFLAECYGRLGAEEMRIDALERASAGQKSTTLIGPALAQAMEKSGRIDDASKLHATLADTRPESRLDLIRLSIQKNLRLPSDQRHWQALEQRLLDVGKAMPSSAETVILLRVEILAAQNRSAEALKILENAAIEHPKSLRFRIAIATVLQGESKLAEARKVLDSAEKEFGANSELRRANIAYWLRYGEVESKKTEAREALVALTGTRNKVPVTELPEFLDELATAWYRFGDPRLAGQLWNELSKRQPRNLEVLRNRADLALASRDQSSVRDIIQEIKAIEGKSGTIWRYTEAAFLMDEVAQSKSKSNSSDIETARGLIEQIITLRGNWWGGFILRGRLSELTAKGDDAVQDYFKAIELGANQPELARRLFVLLYQRQQFDQIDRIVKILADRGMAPAELKLAAAFNAIRRNEFASAIALAREVIPDDSTNPSDLLILSKMLTSAGRLAEAEKLLLRALELSPDLPDVWIDRVRFLVLAKRSPEIPGVLDKASRALKPNQVPLTLALCLSIAGKDEEANKSFQSALTLNPDDLVTIRFAAEFYVKTLKLDQVEKLVAKILDPKSKASPAGIAWANRTRSFLKINTGDQRQVDEAIALLDQNLKISPYNTDDQRARAVLLAMKPGRQEEAVKALEALEKSRLLSPADRFLLAKLYYAKPDWLKCRKILSGLMSEKVRQPDQVAFFVNALIEQNELDEAERSLRLLDPNDPQSIRIVVESRSKLLKARNSDADLLALIQRFSREHPDQIGIAANLFERYGYLKEAEQALKAFVEQNRKEPTRTFAYIGFLARRNRIQEALALCEQAWNTCPDEEVASVSLSVLSSGNDSTEAQLNRVGSWLEKAVQRRPESSSIQNNLATLRTKQRRYDEAEALYQKVLDVSPDNLGALNNKAWLLAFQTGKEKEALDLMDRAISIAGSNATLFDTRAVVHMRMGNATLAIPDLRAALALNPGKSVLYFHLAQAYEMTGSLSEARKALHQAEEGGLKEESIDPLERENYLKVRRQLAKS